MKILRVIAEGLPHFSGNLDIDFTATQRVSDDDKEKLSHVFSNIYVNPVISFVGINASGKTTILKALSFIFSLINNEAINNVPSKEILNDLAVGQSVRITSYFYHKQFVYRLCSSILKGVNVTDETEKLIIPDEKLWAKESARVKTKKSLFDFRDSDLRMERDSREQFLMDDVSIIIAENKEMQANFDLRDMARWTNHNMLNVMGKFPKELLTFLDPSIEYLRGKKVEKNSADVRLKFYGSEEIVLNTPREVEKYLSSGTIKGLNVFINAWFAFLKGGYLIIDELENHFNEEIVVTLVRFFMDYKVNKAGGTLVYSTHYSQLLDEFERNDAIYIVKNKNGIGAENLSRLLNRNDIKRSEAFSSGYLEDTTPSYEAYMDLKRIFSGMIAKEE